MTSHIALHIYFIAAIVASFVYIMTDSPAPKVQALTLHTPAAVCIRPQLYALECRIQAATERLEYQIMRKLLTCGDGSCADFELTFNMLGLSWLNELDRAERELMHDKLSKEEKTCMSDGFQQLKTFLCYRMNRIAYLTKMIQYVEITTALRALKDTDTRTMDFVFHMAYSIWNCVVMVFIIMIAFTVAGMLEDTWQNGSVYFASRMPLHA